jgi:hypothetical protein
MLASAPLWAAHDFLAGSLPGLLADLACIVISSWMLLKYLPDKWKPRQQECSFMEAGSVTDTSFVGKFSNS